MASLSPIFIYTKKISIFPHFGPLKPPKTDQKHSHYVEIYILSNEYYITRILIIETQILFFRYRGKGIKFSAKIRKKLKSDQVEMKRQK